MITQQQRLKARSRPDDMPIMHQDWKEILFLHWEQDPKEIQKTLPPGLSVDTFQEKAYLSITPFLLENVSLPSLPPIPGMSNFIEVNLRTYVYDNEGNPGIWFYSLDLNSSMAAKMAKKSFSLPYFSADLEKKKKGNALTISGSRKDSEIKMKFNYEPLGTPHFAEPETLEFFLLERYALFSFSANQLSIGRVHHAPYPISNLNVMECSTNLIKIERKPDLAHYSSGVSVEIFPLEELP